MPKQALWDIRDETASEVELGDLLYGLVRMLKPKLVVETGTYKGHATLRMLQAIRENGFGKIVTCDPNSYDYSLVSDDVDIQCKRCCSLDLPELTACDFLFSDSDYKWRAAEIGRTKKGCIILVHDTEISYDSQVPPLKGLVEDLGGITFDTYRGFGLLKRTI